MGLNIKNREVESRIRELASLTGTSLTEAVDRAVRNALLDAHAGSPGYRAEVRALMDRLEKLGPPPEGSSSRTDMLYGEDGLPR